METLVTLKGKFTRRKKRKTKTSTEKLNLLLKGCGNTKDSEFLSAYKGTEKKEKKKQHQPKETQGVAKGNKRLKNP